MFDRYYNLLHKVTLLLENFGENALLIHRFVPVKTWLLIACDTAIYALMVLIYFGENNSLDSFTAILWG